MKPKNQDEPLGNFRGGMLCRPIFMGGKRHLSKLWGGATNFDHWPSGEAWTQAAGRLRSRNVCPVGAVSNITWSYLR